jgi:hypothetical protein
VGLLSNSTPTCAGTPGMCLVPVSMSVILFIFWYCAVSLSLGVTPLGSLFSLLPWYPN